MWEACTFYSGVNVHEIWFYLFVLDFDDKKIWSGRQIHIYVRIFRPTLCLFRVQLSQACGFCWGQTGELTNTIVLNNQCVLLYIKQRLFFATNYCFLMQKLYTVRKRHWQMWHNTFPAVKKEIFSKKKKIAASTTQTGTRHGNIACSKLQRCMNKCIYSVQHFYETASS